MDIHILVIKNLSYFLYFFSKYANIVTNDNISVIADKFCKYDNTLLSSIKTHDGKPIGIPPKIPPIKGDSWLDK